MPTILIAAPSAWAGSAGPTGSTGENAPLNVGSSSPTPVHVGGTGSSIVRTIVGLAVVVGVIYGLTWILRQVKSSREDKASGRGLASLATLPLGPNRSVHLIRSGKEYVLVGVAEQGVTPLRTYSEEEALELGLLEEPTPADEQRPALAAAAAGRVAALGRLVRGAGEGGSSRGLVDTVRAWTVRA